MLFGKKELTSEVVSFSTAAIKSRPVEVRLLMDS